MIAPWLIVLLQVTLAQPTREHAILVTPDGHARVVHPEKVYRGELSDGAVWIWSESSPPRRVELGKPSTEPPPPILHLSVAILTAEPRQAKEAVIIAAPRQMWEEVPESLLPRWQAASGTIMLPRNQGELWRLRLTGREFASWWTDVPPEKSRIALEGQPAQVRTLRVEPKDEIRNVATDVISVSSGVQYQATKIATFFTDEPVLTMPPLPSHRSIDLLIRSPGFVDTPLSATVQSLPASIRLDRGSILEGRISDQQGKPMQSAVVRVEGWLSAKFPRMFRRETRSDKAGRWAMENVPAGQSLLIIEHDAYVPYRRKIEIAGKRVDCGSIEMRKGITIELIVRDDQKNPIKGAEIYWNPQRRAQTDEEGRAVLEEIADDESLRLYLKADGFVGRVFVLEEPLQSRSELTLTRGVMLTGRLLDSDFAPVRTASLTRYVGTRSLRIKVGEDGEFETLVPPDTEVELLFTSPETRAVRLVVPPGFSGEQRDLGIITAERGIELTGRLVAGLDGRPLSGGRVWAPRQTEEEALIAWAKGNIAQAQSHADGGFRLQGLEAGPLRVVIDMEGFAREERSLILPAQVRVVELGDIALSEGATVVVASPNAASGAVARLDLRGDWLELDMLMAPFVEGRARFEHVPIGTHWLSVTVDHQVLCESTISVSEQGRTVETECDESTTLVRGVITTGGQPAGAGLLMWSRTTLHAIPSLIINRPTPGGMLGQQIFGLGPPMITVAADAKGRFESDRLRPGPWEVRWLPDSGGESEPRAVAIAKAPEQHLTLAFDTGTVRGRVVDSQGLPVPEAGVYELRRRIAAKADPDGMFLLVGLSSGPLSLQARYRNRVSPVVQLKAPDPREVVTLAFGEDDRPILKIQVIDAQGTPVGGARVFVDTGQSFLTGITRADGQARIYLVPDLSRLRVAVLAGAAWSLGDWVAVGTSLPPQLTTVIRQTGMLTMETEKQGGHVTIIGAGWNLSTLLRLLGTSLFLRPGSAITVPGLPPGDYLVALDATNRTVRIREDSIAEVVFRE